MKTRAQAGGQRGANGEWYEGGKFINTVAANAKGSSKASRPTGKQEFEPYKWAVAPDGGRSIYRQLAGVEIYDRATNTFTFNDRLRSYFATPEAIANRKAKIAAYNQGERWAGGNTEAKVQ